MYLWKNKGMMGLKPTPTTLVIVVHSESQEPVCLYHWSTKTKVNPHQVHITKWHKVNEALKCLQMKFLMAHSINISPSPTMYRNVQNAHRSVRSGCLTITSVVVSCKPVFILTSVPVFILVHIQLKTRITGAVVRPFSVVAVLVTAINISLAFWNICMQVRGWKMFHDLHTR